jgi:hypothetical protein
VKNQLGPLAPNDTPLVSQQIFDQRRKLVDFLPQDQRLAALGGLTTEKINSDLADANWQQ